MEKEWKHFFVKANSIVKTFNKNTLLRMPDNSDYPNYVFWISNKLIQNGTIEGTFAIGYQDGFLIRLKKYERNWYIPKMEKESIAIPIKEIIKQFKL